MNVKAFANKTVQTARNQGVRDAVTASGLEAAMWVMRRATDREFGTPIWDDDSWDICVILDACRADVMGEVAPENDWLPDEPGHKWSIGSASPEWIGRTFAPKFYDELGEVGYVVGNPFSGKPWKRAAGAPRGSLPLSNAPLAYLDEAWQDQWGIGEGEGYLDVIPPQALTQRALYAWENRDGLGIDRLVVHYMQPHIPFRSRPEWFDPWGNLQAFGEPDRGDTEGNKDPWHQARDHELPRDEFWDAYRDNVRWGLEGVDTLRRAVDADILISSDHGNGFGELGVWSHPPEHPAPCLRRVPWVTIQGTNEVDNPVTMKPPASVDENKEMQEKLQALGYLE